MSVLLPYRFTLFSNTLRLTEKKRMFYYLIDLHYSQTVDEKSEELKKFYYLIDLHYSQTISTTSPYVSEFYYLIDLHYSQTHNV